MKVNRSIEDYKKAGACMRLLKAILSKTHVECSEIMYVRDSDKFFALSHKVDRMCSKSEDDMFMKYPKLSSEYCDVFYGSPGNKSRNDVDQEQIDLMIEIVKELFKDNWK